MVLLATADASLLVSPAAAQMVARMRALMLQDICEFDMAARAREANAEMNREQEIFGEAFSAMGSAERAAWKRLLAHYPPER